MESCNYCVGASVVSANRRSLLDNVPQLPDQVGQVDFTRLSDIPTNTNTQSILLLNTSGKQNADVISNPYNTTEVLFLSSDPLWGAVATSNTTIRINGPLGETFTGLMAVIKPQLTV